MLIHGKTFLDLNEEDLQSLVEDQVPEGKFIEYKRTIPSKSDRDKKEFLADVSSFSNTAGGYLFFGITEENGLPQEIIGLEDVDPDAQILRFENLLRDSISPRLPNFIVQPIPTQEGRCVIAFHIQKSWASPHMVTYANTSKFYARNSAGKYQLDVFELRTAFTATTVESERIRNFQIDRLGKIAAGETPAPINQEAQIVLHVIPIGSVDRKTPYDLREFQLAQNREMLAPIDATHGNNFRFNFDGVLTYEHPNREKHTDSYLQLYRNGIIETCCNSLFKPDDNPPSILGIAFEQELVHALGRYIRIYNFLEIEPPFFILLALLNVSGFNLLTKAKTSGRNVNLIDRNELIVPELLVEDKTLLPETILKPVFDAIWNAAGQPQSPFYDADGNWKFTR